MDPNPPPPSAVPLQPPPEHLPNSHNAATASPKADPGKYSTVNKHDYEEGADQYNLPLKNFRNLVYKFIKPLTPADESLIEKGIRDFFPAIYRVPDHPPYAAMIRKAVQELNEEGGSSEDAISDFIKNEYNNLPWAHPTILAHHLHKLSQGGELIITSNRCYILHSAIVNTTSRPSPFHIVSPNVSPTSSAFSSLDSSSCSSPSWSPCSSPSSCSSPPSSTPCSSPSSSSSPHSTDRRRLNQGRGRGRSRKCIQQWVRGGPRKWIQGRGRGRPRKDVESDEKIQLNENWKRKGKEIQTRGRVRPCKSSQGRRGRGRPRKKDQIKEGEQLKEEEQKDEAADHPMTKDENLPVGLAIEEHRQVESNKEIQLNEKWKRKSKEIQKQGRGRPRKSSQGKRRGRPRKKDQIEEYQLKKEERTDVTEDHLMTQDENLPVGVDVAIEEHRQVVDMEEEEIKGKNVEEGQEDQVALGHNREKEQNMTVSYEPQGWGATEEWDDRQKQEQRFGGVLVERAEQQNRLEEYKQPKDTIEDINDRNQSWNKEHWVIQDQRAGLHTYIDEEQQDVLMIRSVALDNGLFEERNRQQKLEKGTIVEQTQSEEHNGTEEQKESTEQYTDEIELQDEQRMLEFEVTEGQHQEEEQVNGMIQGEVQFECKVSEGQCQEDEQRNDVVREEVQIEFKVAEGQHQEEEKKTEVVQLEFQMEQKVVEGDRLLKELQNEAFLPDVQLEDDVVEDQQDVLMIKSQKQSDVTVEEWNEENELGKRGSLEQKQSEAQENDAFQELLLPHKRHMAGIVEKVQQCEQQEKEIPEQDQLQKQNVEVAEELHQQEEHLVEMFQEETQPEEEVLEEQGTVMISSKAVEDGGAETSTGKGKLVKGESVDQKELEDQQDDVIGEQVQAQEIFMAGMRQEIQLCEQEEIAEQNHLVKPEAEVPEGLHQQNEQPNEEFSTHEGVDEQEGLVTIRSEAEEGKSPEEWSKQHKNENGVRAEVNQIEEHENVIKQTQPQEQNIEGNSGKLKGCELDQRIIMQLEDQKEQVDIVDGELHQEEELQVEAFEKQNQLQEKLHESNERLLSSDVSGKESTALLWKSSWSLVEEEREEYLDRFRDKEMRSPYQGGEIPDSSSKCVQKQLDLPLFKGSEKCNQLLQDRVQVDPQFQLSKSEQASTASVAKILPAEKLQQGYGGEGRFPELTVCAPYVEELHQYQPEKKRSFCEGLSRHNRNAEAAPTSENQHGKRQPVRRSPRNIKANLEAAATIEDLEHLKERLKRAGHGSVPKLNIAAADKVLRSGKRIKKAGL